MRKLIVLLLLTACGGGLECPAGQSLDQQEAALFAEVASLLEFPEALPPLLATEPVDPSCPGGWDVRTPRGECVGAYFASRCDTVVLPERAKEAWPAWWSFLVRHEGAHAILRQKTGFPDADHQHWIFSVVRPPWEEGV